MKRILHTESSMNLGGQELRILAEMEGLEEYGFSSILAARPGSRIADEADRRGLKVFRVSMRGSVDPFAVIRFLGIIREEGLDLVCTHGSKDGWSAGTAARILGKKVVRSRNVANPIRSHWAGRLVYGPLCDAVVTTSEFIGKGMIKRGVPPEKILCIPTGIDLRRFHPSVEKGQFREELGVSEETPLVGMISVLRGDKGPDVFLRSAELVLEHRPHPFFTVVGDGWMRKKLEDMVAGFHHKERIRLTGFRRDIPHIMADLNLLILPARVPEGVPQTILQAHAMKIPVIASDVGGVNEAAIHDETALLVPPGNPMALAQCIERALDDPGSMRRLAEKGHEMVTSAFGLEAWLERMAHLYQRVLGASPTAGDGPRPQRFRGD